MKYPLIATYAVGPNFHDYVAQLIQSSASKFVKNRAGPNRQFFRFEDKHLEVMRRSLAEMFGFEHYEPEPNFGNYIGWITEGGFIHEHKDPAPTGFVHVRVNVMHSKPCKGGNPYIDGQLIEVNKGDAWVCLSSLQDHKTDIVVGSVPRQVVSFGYVVKAVEMRPQLQDYYDWLKDT